MSGRMPSPRVLAALGRALETPLSDPADLPSRKPSSASPLLLDFPAPRAGSDFFFHLASVALLWVLTFASLFLALWLP